MTKLDDLINKLCPGGVPFSYFYDCCEYARGITFSDKDTSGVTDGIPVLRANNISLFSNELIFTDVKLVKNTVKVKSDQWLKKGDILICAGSGSKEHVGKVAFIFEDLDYAFGGFMGVIRPKGPQINSRFLFHVLTSSRFKDHLRKTSGAMSSTINNINKGTFKDFRIPVPKYRIRDFGTNAELCEMPN